MPDKAQGRRPHALSSRTTGGGYIEREGTSPTPEMLTIHRRSQPSGPRSGTTALAAVGSLGNAVVSAGLLALSAEVAAVGNWTFLALLLATAALAATTLWYLYWTSRKLGVQSYEGVAHALWGRWGERAVLGSLILGQLGTVFAYFSVLRDTLPWVLQHSVLGCAAVDSACQWSNW